MGDNQKTRSTVWRPFRPQHEFISTPAVEALFGGAAGGGKSTALLVAAARYVRHPTYRALLLRRTSPEIRRTLGLESARFYGPDTPLRGRRAGNVWYFPSGATIELGGIEHESDVYQYSSAEFQFIGFDELTTFTQWQYEFLLSRLRSSDPTVRCVVRSATNPLGPHVDWVRKRWRWWVYRPGHWTDEFDGPYAKPGEVLWIARDSDGEERLVEPGTPGAISRVFIPARLSDNPVLAATSYADRLMALDPVTRRQLLDGDWLVRAAPGTFFRREWFRVREPLTGGVVARCRYWDRAATEVTKHGRRDPDWTVGLLLALTREGRFVVEDVVRARLEPAEVARLIVHTAQRDAGLVPAPSQRLEQEPGSSGKADVAALARMLAGYHVTVVRPTGDKQARARPVAAQAAPPASNIEVVRAPWNDAFFAELESFPSPNFHDDQVDALSGALEYLAPMVRRGVVQASSAPGTERTMQIAKAEEVDVERIYTAGLGAARERAVWQRGGF